MRVHAQAHTPDGVCQVALLDKTEGMTAARRELICREDGQREKK